MIAWTAPSDNSAAIDKYQLMIGDSAGQNYYENTTLCDGSISLVMSQLYCIVPVANLRISPFNLIKLDLITAIVRAHNSRGWSANSTVNTVGEIVRTEPD